jgi:hypothetical protein
VTALTLAACGGQGKPQPSHAGPSYRVKVDDAVQEAASVELVTTREAVISVNCDEVAKAGDSGLGALIARGDAARLPANVTIYGMPSEQLTADALPYVVTDDGYAGKLCTPHAFAPLKTS